jgi:hypothetical protein
MTDASNAAWLERIGQVKPETKPATPTKKEEE